MEPFFVTLPPRGLIQIEGEERRSFLQGLISNDINRLDHQSVLYGCLLSAQGKFLHDFFISAGPDDVILLECEGGARAQDLYTRLNLYRLRAKVKISIEDSIPVYAGWGTQPPAPFYPDPRHPAMGWRSFTKPADMPERPFAEWDRRRLHLGIPDGSRDMMPEFSTLLESRVDQFKGVSFEKGCYVGQELTARMNYRGLAKKHLYPVQAKDGAALPASGSDIEINGKLAGQMRSSCGDLGLALLKDDLVATPEGAPFHIIVPEVLED